MYDFDHNKKLYDVSEALRYEMNRRAVKYNLNYCEDAILDLIDLTVKIDNMTVSKKPDILQEVKKLYNGVSQYENDNDTENESIEYEDYYELSEDSDTGEIIGFRNM